MESVVMRAGLPLRLVTAALLAASGALCGWAAGIDPDALTVADFAFMPGADPRFVDAYRAFLKAKAGDQDGTAQIPAYGQAAQAFLAVAADTGKPDMRLRCAWFGALCQFLDMDLAGAAQTVDTVLTLGDKARPRETADLRDVLRRVDGGQVATAEALIPLLKGSDDEASGPEPTVARTLAALLDRAAQTREARQKLTSYPLRTQLLNLGSTRAQLRTIAVLAGFFRGMSVSVSDNREKLDQAVCAANLRHLGVLLHLYGQDHGGSFPEKYDPAAKQVWQQKVLAHSGTRSWADRDAAWRCPSCVADGYSYGINISVSIRSRQLPTLGSRDGVAKPHETVLLADSVHYMPGDYPQKPNYGGAAYEIHADKEHSGTGTVDWTRHDDGANVLFVDGRVEWRCPGMSMEWKGR